MSEDDAILSRAAGLRRDNAPFALATVVRSEGATSAKAGAKAIVTADGAIEGWIGGGCSQPAVLSAARHALVDGKARLIRIRPGEDDRDDGACGEGVDAVTMTCQSGGSLDIFVEPMLAHPRLFVLGASRAGQALAGLARRVGFTVTAAVLKSDAGAIAEADRLVEGFDLGDAAREGGGFVVVATQGKGDRRALEAALESGASYVAFISSRRKAETLKRQLAASGHDPERVAAIRAPAGIDIGAATPEEVAVAILAELVRERRRGLEAGAARRASEPEPGGATEVTASVAAGCCGGE